MIIGRDSLYVAKNMSRSRKIHFWPTFRELLCMRFFASYMLIFSSFHLRVTRFYIPLLNVFQFSSFSRNYFWYWLLFQKTEPNAHSRNFCNFRKYLHRLRCYREPIHGVLFFAFKSMVRNILFLNKLFKNENYKSLKIWQ